MRWHCSNQQHQQPGLVLLVPTRVDSEQWFVSWNECASLREKREGYLVRDPFQKAISEKLNQLVLFRGTGTNLLITTPFWKFHILSNHAAKRNLPLNEEMKKPWSLSSLVPQPIKQTMRPHPSSGCTVLNVWQEGGGGGISLLSINHHLSTRGHHHHQSPSPLPASGSSFFRGEGGVVCASHSHNRVIKWGAGGIDHYTELEDNEIIRTHKIGIRGSRFAQIKKWNMREVTFRSSGTNLLQAFFNAFIEI